MAKKKLSPFILCKPLPRYVRVVRTVDIARWNPKRSGAVRTKAIKRARRLIAKGNAFPEVAQCVFKRNGELVSFVFVRWSR